MNSKVWSTGATILCFAFCIHTYGQAANDIDSRLDLCEKLHYSFPDSVRKMCWGIVETCHQAKNDEELPRVYNEIGNTFYVEGKLDSAIKYYAFGVNISRSTSNKLYEGVCLTNVGQILVGQGRLKEAVDTLYKAEPLLKLERDELKRLKYLLGVYANYGDLYTQAGVYDRALENLFHAIGIAKQVNDENSFGSICNSIGAVYSYLKEYNKAILYYREARESFKRQKYSLGVGLSYYNVAEALSFKGAFDSALLENKIAFDTLSNVKYDIGLGYVFGLYGNIFQKKSRLQDAQRYYQKAIEAYNKAGTAIQVAQTRTGLSDIFLKQKLYDQADSELISALSIFKQSGAKKEIRDVYLQLAGLETQKGELTKAIQYYKDYTIANEDFLNDERTKEISKQEIKYETSLKEAQIKQQKAELQLRRIQNLWLIISSLFALIIASILGLQYARIKKQKKIIESQKREVLHTNRNNISRLISIFSQQAKDPALKQSAEANQERLFTLNLLSRLMYEGEDNEQLRLNIFLAKLCDAKQIAYDIPIKLQIASNVQEINPDLIKDIGLIVNELTTNAAKHAFDDIANPLIEIVLERKGKEWLQLTIRDNGKGLPAGFDLSQQRSSFGLGFVRDLVAQHDGNIKANNNGGALFTLLLKS